MCNRYKVQYRKYKQPKLYIKEKEEIVDVPRSFSLLNQNVLSKYISDKTMLYKCRLLLDYCDYGVSSYETE